MNNSRDYCYSKEHTWLRQIGQDTALVGITDFAQSELGEIVFVELPSIGKVFQKDEIFGSVEAVKTTSDLFIPVAGEILEINPALKGNAGLVNTAPLTEGWMIKIRILKPEEIKELLVEADY